MARPALSERLGRWGLRACLVGLAIFCVAMALFRLGQIGHLVLLGGLALVGLLALLALVMAVAALITGLGGDRRKNQTALMVLVLSLLLAYGPLTMARKLDSVPLINDISTDLVDTPRFIAVPDLRKPTDNSVEIDRDEQAKQKAFYTGLTGLDSALAPQKAFERAMEQVQDMGWDIVMADATQGHIEATDTTAFLGFKDDIVIRIVATDTGSKIDMRSASRLGRSDLGVNAARIDAFLTDFAD